MMCDVETGEFEQLRARLFLLLIALGALVLLLGALRFVSYDGVTVGGSSMRTALEPGDRVFFSTSSDVERGDIVLMRRPDQPETRVIVRVVGLGEEKLDFVGGQVFIDGFRLDEPYVSTETNPVSEIDLNVPAGHVFVMGDNRTASADSRIYGAVPVENIDGIRAQPVWWPSFLP